MILTATFLVGLCAFATIALLLHSRSAFRAVDEARAHLRRTARYYDEGARYVAGRNLLSEVAAVAKSAIDRALGKPS